MFGCAITCLVVALLAAVVSFSGVLNADATVTALHIYFIVIGLFVVSAIATILDLTPLRDVDAASMLRLRLRSARVPVPPTDRATRSN